MKKQKQFKSWIGKDISRNNLNNKGRISKEELFGKKCIASINGKCDSDYSPFKCNGIDIPDDCSYALNFLELQNEIFRLKQELELIKSKSTAWRLDLNEPIPKNHNQRMFEIGYNQAISDIKKIINDTLLLDKSNLYVISSIKIQLKELGEKYTSSTN